MIVLDASVVIELLLGGEAARRIEDRLYRADDTWSAPHLLDIEVVNVVRRTVAQGDMTADRGQQAVEDLLVLPIRRYPHDVLLSRVWELRHNFTGYDAVYLALAEALSAPLLTRDQRLARAPGCGAEVEVLGC